MTRVALRICLAAALIYFVYTIGTSAAELYRGQAIVTGQGEANRTLGVASCLEDVLIKVSGFQGLAGDPRLTPYKSNAENLVEALNYHDQMSGTATRDEQGTRDRPYDLIVDFDPKKIDDLLKALGIEPWLARRPLLGVLVGLQQGATNFIITDDADRSALQRESLLAAASKRGMAIVLPSMVALKKSNINYASLSTIAPSILGSVTAARGGEVVLVGRLVWDDRDLGWAVQWQMDWQNRTRHWQMRGVTFDEAFRRGIGNAAQILSNNGDPP